MNTLLHDQVIVPENRQRTEVPEDHIATLMASIFDPEGPGLLNPITLREGKTLVAGECRLRAIRLGYNLGKGPLRHAGKALPEGHLPFIDFGELSPIAQMEAEYVENARRLDLTWQDNVKAIAALNALRKAQAETKGESHTHKDTAKELFKRADGSFADQVAKSVLLADRLNDPDISKAKSFNEARKILAKKVDAETRVTLAQSVGKTLTSERMRAYNADCVKWMRDQTGEQFDVILTDPPYGMGADSFGDAAGRLSGTTHEYLDTGEHFQRLLTSCIPEFYRLAKAEAHLYLWCDIDWFHWLRDECRQAGWWVHRTPLINIKPEGGRVPWPEHGPRRAYEICLYAVKGKKPVTAIKPDVFESRLTEGNFGHGAQKPVAAYVDLLGRSVKPGDHVFDAFAGTGTIFAAAAELKCYATGIEMEEAAFGTCIRRIQELDK